LGASTAGVGEVVYRLEQHLFRSSGTFELFSPSIEFVIRELTAGVALQNDAL
jgi:hypothetical protein